ncbi:hypothetical protein ACLI1A_10100 [Flavobacterium sp. RHBU_3]|uniref:hypothetical protein n=1 Tax=Flavobacterium sp. RHBU_3 TaxID=3391184 RepID=UPI0039853E7E
MNKSILKQFAVGLEPQHTNPYTGIPLQYKPQSLTQTPGTYAADSRPGGVCGER